MFSVSARYLQLFIVGENNRSSAAESTNPSAPPSGATILQRADQIGNFQSFVQDGVSYTTITLPNTTINPTLPNTTYNQNVLNVPIPVPSPHGPQVSPTHEPQIPAPPPQVLVTPAPGNAWTVETPRGENDQSAERLPEAPTIRDLDRPGKQGTQGKQGGRQPPSHGNDGADALIEEI